MVFGAYRILREMMEGEEVALLPSPEPLPSLLFAAAGEMHVCVCVRSEVHVCVCKECGGRCVCV